MQVRSASSVQEAVRQCVVDPPLAVLIDLASTLHAGVAETAPLYDLGIDMPILRCTGGGDAPWTAMCQAPFRRMVLSQAAAEIAKGDPSWSHPVHLRKFVRVSRNVRVLFRPAGSEPWRRGNTQSLSVSGFFLMTQEPSPVGSDVELRLLDCGEGEISCNAVVAWIHHWEEGTHIPGVGLDLDRSTVPDAFGSFLADAFIQAR